MNVLHTPISKIAVQYPSFSSLPFNPHHLLRTQINQLPIFSIQLFFFFTPLCSSLHNLLCSPSSQKLKTGTNWTLETNIILLVAGRKALLSCLARLLSTFRSVSVPQTQTTLPLLAQKLKPFQKLSFLVYLLPFLSCLQVTACNIHVQKVFDIIRDSNCLATISFAEVASSQ